MLIAAIHRMGLVTFMHTPSTMGFLAELFGRPANERADLLMPVGFPAPGVKVPALPRRPPEQIGF